MKFSHPDLPSRPPVRHKLAPSARVHFGNLLGVSRPMREVFALLERVSRSDVAILIEGETGTGKELCAEAIHAHSPRRKAPFVICDLGGLSRTLIESELFGHVRGAFTGAERDNLGAFMQAKGGTLFIDEIGELERTFQPRLLRSLEQRRVKPVGAQSYLELDARIIAATNRDLREEVRLGEFRQDLYHRLAVVRIRMPSLRDRREDIAPLLHHFLAGHNLDVPSDTLSMLNNYDWPGNVRELRNLVERAISLRGHSRTLESWMFDLDADLPVPACTNTRTSTEGLFSVAKEKVIANWEHDYVTQLLDRAKGNVSKAAREGGMDRVYLHRLMKKHRIGAQ